MLRTMDPSIVRKLLEEQPDTLSEEVKKEEELFQRLSCPMCKERGGCEKRLTPPKVVVDETGAVTLLSSPFSSEYALPQGYAHCAHCGTDFDPHSGVISRTETTGIAPVDSDPASKILVPPLGSHQE